MKKPSRGEASMFISIFPGRICLPTKLSLILIVMLAFNLSAYANSLTYDDYKGKTRSSETLIQQIMVKGRVTDQDGNPLPGVNVVIQGTSVGVATNINGEYMIEAGPDQVLEFTFIGMEKQTIKIDGRKQIDVELKAGSTELDQVVVVGYQEVKKRNTTASIVTANADDIENSASSSFETLLQGRLAGVNIQSISGEPGVKNVFVIRGNTNISSNLEGEINAGGTGFSNPLYVLDGVPTTLEDLAGYDATNTNFLASLNTNDIESIDILKDASAAAIYGSRGANGVVIIKTKKGRKGEPEFSFNAYGGLTSVPNLVPVEVGVAERRAKYDLINNYWDYNRQRNNIPMILTDSLNPAFNNNVNYQGMFYKPGIIQNYDFGVSGGTETTNYRVSLGYYDEDGIVTNTGFQRTSISVNLGIKLGERLDNQTVVRIGYVDRQTGLGNASPRWGTFPIEPLQMNSSLLYLSDEERKALMGEYDLIRNKNINLNGQISNILRLQLAKGLHLNNTIAVGLNTTKRDFFAPSVLNTNNKTLADYTWTGNKSVTVDNFLSYIKDLGEAHQFNILLGNSINYNQNEYLNTGGRGAASDQIQTVTGIDQDNIWGYSDFSENGMVSFWGRLGYRLLDKYLLDLNFRTDGSSRFGKNTRWGYFPALSAGWLLSEESFVKNSLPWVDFAKLRASWGINGTQFSSDYLRFNAYNSGNGYYLPSGNQPVSTYNGVTVVSPNWSKLANDNLSWEQSVQWTVGMDLELFGHRLWLTPEIYNRETQDLLFDVNFPIETGYTNSQANIAGVRNYGWELSATAYILPAGGDFQWQVDFNVARNFNQVTKLPNGNRDWYSGTRSLTVGLPMNQYRLLMTDGVYGSIEDIPVNPYTGQLLPIRFNGTTGEGYFIWRDVNGDYEIAKDVNLPDADLRAISGKDPNPKYTGGFSNTIKYKNWNLRIVSSYVQGRTIYNNTLVTSLYYIGTGNPNTVPIGWATHNQPVMSNIDYWRQTGDVAKYSRMDPGGRNQFLMRLPHQSIWLEDGSFLKIDNITLSYNFKKSQLKNLRLKYLRFYAMVNNVLTLQKFTGPDAERVDVTGKDIGSGYAMPKKYTLGVNIRF